MENEAREHLGGARAPAKAIGRARDPSPRLGRTPPDGFDDVAVGDDIAEFVHFDPRPVSVGAFSKVRQRRVELSREREGDGAPDQVVGHRRGIAEPPRHLARDLQVTSRGCTSAGEDKNGPVGRVSPNQRQRRTLAPGQSQERQGALQRPRWLAALQAKAGMMLVELVQGFEGIGRPAGRDNLVLALLSRSCRFGRHVHAELDEGSLERFPGLVGFGAGSLHPGDPSEDARARHRVGRELERRLERPQALVEGPNPETRFADLPMKGHVERRPGGLRSHARDVEETKRRFVVEALDRPFSCPPRRRVCREGARVDRSSSEVVRTRVKKLGVAVDALRHALGGPLMPPLP
jgi:hypothetical protein